MSQTKQTLYLPELVSSLLFILGLFEASDLWMDADSDANPTLSQVLTTMSVFCYVVQKIMMLPEEI